MTDPKIKALLKARAAEMAGNLAEAAELFRAAGQLEESARVLAHAGKPLEAAQLLLGSLGVRSSQVGTLEVKLKARALKAAIQLGRAGEIKQAVEIFLALGERARAAQLLDRSGDPAGAAKLLAGKEGTTSNPGKPRPAAQAPPVAITASGQADSPVLAGKLEAGGQAPAAMEMWLRLKRFGEAARVAKGLGLFPEAARLYSDAGMYFDSSLVWRQQGELQHCLESLLRLSRGDRRYRQAATEAVLLAVELDQVNPSLPPFLAALIESGPQSEKDLETFDELSRLYLRHDAADRAREVLEKMVERSPKWRDAARRLQTLTRERAQQAARPPPTQRPARAGQVPDDPLAMHPFPEPPQEEAKPATPAFDASLFFGDVPQPFEELEPLEEVEVEVLVPLIPAATAPRPAAVVSVKPAPAVSVKTAPAAPVVAPPASLAKAAAAPAAATPAAATSAAAAPKPAPPRPSVPVPQPTPPPPVLARPGEPAALRVSNPGYRAAAALFVPALVVANRYRLEQKIGQGGMAAVFRATDLELEEQVALKVFSMVEASDVAVARFKQELKLSRQLSHPNITRLYDIGLHDGHRYISMELLRGRSLKSRMNEPIDFLEALRLLEQACLGLQAAHDQGVIHRDVKPDNFFLTENGVLKVMDFGIAKHQAAQSLTVVGSIAGTPAYMSPEQISNFSAVTHKTDLYALGVMAYEIFTGSQPFQHSELVPLLLLHVNQPPEPPRERNPGIPEELEEVILKLLEKDPARRHQSAHDLAEDLARIRRNYGG